MNRNKFLCFDLTTLLATFLMLCMQAHGGATERQPECVLNSDSFRHYIDTFNKNDEELYTQVYANSNAWGFLKENIPLLECPDKEIEQTYYFRWWTYRKHIKQTSDGFVITEFLPSVPWAGKYNTICCPAGHHFYEGRWLHDSKFLNDYAVFWFRAGSKPRLYSFWVADSIWARTQVNGDDRLAKELLPSLIKNYEAWEGDHRDGNGLFWQMDDRDGMEVSISGALHPKGLGYRATINSYMYGDARAIAQIADRAGQQAIANRFRGKAVEIKRLIEDKLWDPAAQFFKVLPRGENTKLSDARELHGFTPWYFHLPSNGKGYEVAWKQLLDPKGFFASFGPTTAEQRHPGFKISYQGHGCQWNGPSWPFSTAITLTGMANVLNDYQQDAIDKSDYLKILKIYAQSHHRTLPDGQVVSWIDENLNPYTGDWIARTRCEQQNELLRQRGQTNQILRERGKDYNHSTFCDLVITGLIGLRPRADDVVEVNPLIPVNTWDYFCLDNISYHGRTLTILWDKTGAKYGKGKGLQVFADGHQIARSDVLGRISGRLMPAGK